jgi:hypothetical protein
MNCPECKVHVDEHEAGRCMDAWVAEKVMDEQGWNWHGAFGHKRERVVAYETLHYSTDIAAAWKVVEKMENLGFYVDVANDMMSWIVDFIHIDKSYTAT